MPVHRVVVRAGQGKPVRQRHPLSRPDGQAHSGCRGCNQNDLAYGTNQLVPLCLIYLDDYACTGAVCLATSRSKMTATPS
jgi:hypothetical protein